MSLKLPATLKIDQLINTAAGRSTQSTTLSVPEAILGHLQQQRVPGQ